MSSEIEKKKNIELTADNYQDIENLAGTNYTVKQIAMYLNVSHWDLQRAYEDTESEFRYHYDRGKLIVNAKIDTQASDLAQKGNLTAVQIYKKSAQETKLNQLKYEYFGL